MDNTYGLIDRDRSSPCLVYRKSENVDFSWMHFCAEHSNVISITPNGLPQKGRICGVLKIQTHNSQLHLQKCAAMGFFSLKANNILTKKQCTRTASTSTGLYQCYEGPLIL